MTHDESYFTKIRASSIPKCVAEQYRYRKCKAKIEAIEGELAPLSKSQIRRITKVKSDELREKELK